MLLELPMTNDPAQQWVSELAGVKWLFRTQHNTRSASWTLDILRENNEALSVGLPLVLGADLLANHRVMDGMLFVVDYSNSGIDPSAEDWGVRCGLFWSDGT